MWHWHQHLWASAATAVLQFLSATGSKLVLSVQKTAAMTPDQPCPSDTGPHPALSADSSRPHHPASPPDFHGTLSIRVWAVKVLAQEARTPAGTAAGVRGSILAMSTWH